MMTFHVPTRIVFGSGALNQLAAQVTETLAAKRLFVVTDPGVEKAGITERVIRQVPGAPVFSDVAPNPRHDVVNRASGRVRDFGPEALVGVGGGSVIDAAKALALLATNPGRIEDYEGRSKYRVPPLPVVAVPTTCGTGSEVTWVSVITHTERRFKMSIKGPDLFPALAVVDPDLLQTLPASLVASTGIDAMTHAVEAYTARPATPVTDALAREALRHIFASLEAAVRDVRQDKRAREGLMLGSLLAGMAFGNSDVGAVHCLAEAVGALYDIPHGVANAVFLPWVMAFNLPAAETRYADIARIAGIREPDDETAALRLIDHIRSLCRTLGIPSLQGLGLDEAEFVEIARKSFENNSNPSNPREARVEDYLAILAQAFREGSA
ncbi:MAG: iron-containing alcohol dehydrogenase [Candidatus Aminicenantales bacterium]